MKALLYILFLGGLPFVAYGQIKKRLPLEVGISAGLANYAGDLADNPFEWREFRFAAGVKARIHFSPWLSVQMQYINTFLTGNDRNLTNLSNRNFQFSTKVNELSLRTDVQLVSLSRYVSIRNWLTNFSFYSLAGGGWSFIKPEAQCNGLRDDCQKAMKVTFPEPNTPRQLPVFLGGVGVRYFDGERWFSSVEIGMRATFSDLLDGVSINVVSQHNDYYFLINFSSGLLLNRSPRHAHILLHQ